MEITKEIQIRSERIQLELQHIVDLTHNPAGGFGGKAYYQDCMNVAIFTKLAELEIRIDELQYQNHKLKAQISP